MKKLLLILLLSVLYASEGYYSDIYMDSGVDIWSETDLYAADSLGLDFEFCATERESLQTALVIGNVYDENGILLYPDGEPRFRLIYTNGGSATNHGNSLGETGRQRIRDFFYSGGSYTGSCAGAYITSVSYRTTGTWEAYYHIWPGRTGSTGLIDTPTGQFIPEDSPILDYYDFGGDFYIADVYHTGGCYAREALDWPAASEVLLRFDYPPLDIHNKVSSWAYKEDTLSGRLCVIGSHPEQAESGEQLDFMKAIMSYAMDGNGVTNLKAELENGITRTMNRETWEDLPEYTKIGDLQYHHFKLEIPEAGYYLGIELDGDISYDFELYLKKDGFAFNGDADYSEVGEGSDKTIYIPSVQPGTWYVSVKCITTISRESRSWGFEYTGDLNILNGAEYSISAHWGISTDICQDSAPKPDNPNVFMFPNPFNKAVEINFDIPENDKLILNIFDINGNNIKELYSGAVNAGNNSFLWDGTDNKGIVQNTGVYIVKGRVSKYEFSEQVIFIK